MTAPSLQQHLRAVAQFARTRGQRDGSTSAASLRQLVESIPAGAYTCDAEGRITHYNRQAIAVWGRAPRLNDERDRFCGSLRLFAPDGSPVSHDDCWTALALRHDREYIGEEIVVERPDGSRANVLAHATPIHDSGGMLIGALNVLADISDLRHAEDERRSFESQLQQMRSSESLGVLAGGIAHDFNNLLNRINGNATLGQRQLPADSAALPLLADIRQAVSEAAALVEQLLSYAGEGDFAREAVRLDAAVLDAMAGIRQRRADATAIRFELGPATAEGDEDELCQIVTNLVLNALDALDGAPGDVTIRTREDDVDAARLRSRFTAGVSDPAPGRYAIIEVEDSGPGMSDDVLKRIFDPFFTTRFIGRGLGLSAVLGATRTHGGIVQVESIPGDGTCFRVLLPASTAASAAASASAAAEAARTGPADFDPSQVFPLFNSSRRP